jgi:hypothetical protein
MTRHDVLELLKLCWRLYGEAVWQSYGRVEIWYLHLPCLVQLLVLTALVTLLSVTVKYQEPIDAFFEKALR